MKNLNNLGQNLLRNPDLESQNMSGWKGINGIGNIKVSSERKTGTGSFELQIASDKLGNEIGLEQTLPVQNDKSYLFSASIKSPDVLDQPDFLAGIRQSALRAQFITKDGKPVGIINRIAINPD